MNSFITIIKYDIALFFLFGNYDGNFHRKMTFVHCFCNYDAIYSKKCLLSIYRVDTSLETDNDTSLDNIRATLILSMVVREARGQYTATK